MASRTLSDRVAVGASRHIVQPAPVGGSAHHGWYGEPADWVALQLPAGPARGLGVVLCTPLGHEGVVAYRGLRLLADELQRRGIASVRYDPPGRGDAAASDDPSAIFSGARTAAALLREAGCARVAFVGLSSAALVASEVAEPGDVLVLWSPPPSGRMWLRRARSLATILLGPDRSDDGIESLAGLELTDDQAAVLAAVVLALPGGAPALVAPRAGESAPKGLDGAETIALAGTPEFLDVTSTASVIPVAAISTIANWLAGHAGSAAVELGCPELADELSGDGWTERQRWLGPDRNFAVECRPAGASGSTPVVLLHSGASEHRVGPADFQVELARRLAIDGFASVRADRRGTGETGPVDLDALGLMYSEEWVKDQQHMLADLQVPDGLLVTAGLCSGAWLAGQEIVDRRRLVIGIHQTWYRTQPLAPGEFDEKLAPQVITGGVKLHLQNLYRRWAPAWLRRLRARTWSGDAEAYLDDLTARAGEVVLLVSETEHEVLRRGGGDAVASRVDNLVTVELPGTDHPMFARRTRQRVISEIRALLAEAFPAGG